LANTTIGFGIVLIVLGFGGYFGSDRVSPTALIPAAFGLLLVIFGALARDEKRRKMAMHIAVTVGLLDFSVQCLDYFNSHAAFGRRRGGRERSCRNRSWQCSWRYTGCVKSFIDARRRQAGA
jgi:mannose/fructose/N-acetylgalactosamine-specific phosphotransferase system component IIC